MMPQLIQQCFKANRFFSSAMTMLMLLFFSHCIEGESYCEAPKELKGILVEPLYSPYQPVKVSLNYTESSVISQENTLYSFSVPSVFENPKGADRPTDVTNRLEYTYQVIDPVNVPATVEIQAYVFNDCGQSNVVTQVINFLK
ncbi:MAG: hypothetical protein RI909_187 [Bacteroidota bacterium]